jgi:hypothetical protein
MSTSIMFDTLKYTKKAKEVGFTEQQAEFQAQEIAQLIDEKLATKQDLEILLNKITIRLGGMLVAGIAVLGILVGLFK